MTKKIKLMFSNTSFVMTLSLLMAIFGLSIILLIIWENGNKKSYSEAILKYTPTDQFQDDDQKIDSQSTPKPFVIPQKQRVWTLTRKQDNLPNVEVLSVIKKDNAMLPLMERWEEYLLFAVYENYQGIKLWSHNLQTGVSHLLLTDNSKRAGYPGEFALIDNQMFFITHGYLRGNVIYQLDYPPLQPPQKIGGGHEIKKINGKYWIIAGFGDGCGGSSSYYQYDPYQKQSTLFFTGTFGCAGDTAVFGIDSLDRLIIASHSAQLSLDMDPYNKDYFTNIRGINVNNFADIQSILSEEEMPDKIVSYEKSDNQDEIILLQEIDNENRMPLILNTVTKELKKGEPKTNAYTSDDEKKSFPELVEALDLPDNYYVETRYETTSN